MSSYVQQPVDSGRWRRAGNLVSRVLLAAGYGVLVVVLPPARLPLLFAPIAIMLVVTLWMLPDRRTFPLAALSGTFSVYLVLSILWPSYLAVALPGLPWLTPTRIVLFVQSFLLVYSLATSRELRHFIGRVARQSPWVWVCFLIWEATQLITLPLASSLVYSGKIFLDNQFALAGVFFLGCLLFARRGWASWVVSALIVMALITSVDGFIELRLGYPPWANHIPSFLRADEGIMRNVLGAQSRTADGLYRVHGPFPISLVFAEFLALCLPFVVHKIFTLPNIATKVVLGLAVVFIVSTILITQSRLGLVGALITFGTYPPLWAFRIWRSGRGGMLGPSLLFGAPAAVVLLLGVVLSSHSMTTRIFGGGAQTASDEARRIQREMAYPKIVRNPIGYGMGNSGGVLGFTNPGGYLTIDNGVIAVALDQGIAGAFAFIGLLFAAVRRGVIVYLNSHDPEISLAGPAAIALLNFIVIRWVLAQENNFPVAFLLLGMILGLVARDRFTRGETVVDEGLAVDPAQDTPMPVAAVTSVARIAG